MLVRSGLGLVGLEVSKPLEPERVVDLRRRDGVLEFRNVGASEWQVVPETDDWSTVVDMAGQSTRFEERLRRPEGERFGFTITRESAR